VERQADPEEPPANLSAVPSPSDEERDATSSREPPKKTRPKQARMRRGAFATAHPREVGAVILMAAGIALVVLGWWGAAHSELFIDQVPYLISGGVLGLGLIITAAVVGASALNERSLRELRRDIVLALRMGPGGVDGGAPENRDRVLLVPGGRTYHLPGCPIPEGKQGVEETTLAEAAGRGYVACKLCGLE
jgi:hypothetical protein